MIELIMVVAMPFIVKATTGAVKNIGPLPMLSYRVLIIRAMVAVFALLGAIGTVLVGDITAGELDLGLVETAVLAVINAGVATWLYVKTR